MNVFREFGRQCQNLWNSIETADDAKARGKRLCEQLNAKIENGEFHYVYRDEPVVDCKCEETGKNDSGNAFPFLNVMTKTNCFVKSLADFYKMEEGFNLHKLDERTWTKSDAIMSDVSELTKSLRKFGLQEVSKNAFEMAKWMHADTKAYVEVNTEGLTIKENEYLEGHTFESVETGSGFEPCSLIFNNDSSVEVDVSPFMDVDTYRRFTCIKPEFKIQGEKMHMTCTNLPREIEFQRQSWKKA